MPKPCLVCGTDCELEALTCPACGESSFAPSGVSDEEKSADQGSDDSTAPAVSQRGKRR